MTREGRKFRIELWVSSQNISELSDLLPNVGERNIFRVAAGNEAKNVTKLTGWGEKHKKKIIEILSGLNNYEYFDPVDIK